MKYTATHDVITVRVLTEKKECIEIYFAMCERIEIKPAWNANNTDISIVGNFNGIDNLLQYTDNEIKINCQEIGIIES
jgi:hypothetical protein